MLHESRVRQIFLEALEKPTPKERDAYLDGACRGDASLRSQIEVLLKSHREDSFLERPAVELEKTVIAPDRSPSESPGDIIGRYKLLEKIGEGGFGAVYVAEQREPVKRRVALKIIKLGMDTRQVVARFEAERQALALMDHPNIAKVLDAGATEAGRPYFVMELVRGIPITQYCDENHLSTDERLKLFMLVCQAIQHAHQKGIIHRDIKPSNILLTVNDGVPVPKVIDFGIAKATQGELTDKTIYTQFQQFIGTPAYMSPEQADMTSLDIDTRSDIYALGVLLYELLVGKTPFDGKELLMSGLDEMRRTIREKEPVRPSTRLASLVGEERTTTAKRRGADMAKLTGMLRGDVDWIVMKCLEKDRTRRYETANGLAADINRFLANEPVMARPPSAAYRFQKAFRRNKLAFTAAAVVGVVLVVGVMVSTWQAFEASRARNAERKQRVAAQTERDKAQTAQKEAERAQQAEKQERQRAEKREGEAGHLLYIANMNLAQSAWEQNNVRRVRQLLDDTATYPERGFEWYYWQRQTHLEIRTLRGHTGLINSVAFSPDGKRIVTGSWDQTAKVWDAASGKELFTLNGHSDAITSVAFSPDGQRIATGSKDTTAKVWEAGSGRELLILKGHSTWVNSVAFSPDGQHIVTGSGGETPKDDHTAKVWELASGKEIVTLAGHTDGILSLAYSSNGQRIVTASRDKTAKVWEPANGKDILTFEGHSGPINGVAFSPDGQSIVTGSDDRTTKVWDTASGKVLLTLRANSTPINSVAFSPDGQSIVTGDWDQTARVWKIASGEELLTFRGHTAQICSVAFSPDGRSVVTSSGDWMSTAEHTAKIWEVSSSKEVLTLEGHSNNVTSAIFSPDGQRIVTSSEDGTTRVWNGASGKELLVLNGYSEQVYFAAFSPNGQRIVTCESDRTAKIWDAVTGKELLTLKGHTDNVFSAAFSPDNQRIVTGSLDGTGKVWDAPSGKELLTLRGGAGRVWSVAFSPDGQRIVTGTDGRSKVWEAASGKKLLVLNGHRGFVVSAAFSPDGQRIATSSSDGTAKVWDAKNGKELLTLEGHGDQVWSVAFSPDGRRIVTGSADRTAKVWESISGKELLTLKGHSHFVRSADFSPDGKRIVTGSWDKTAKVWKAATPQQVTAWQQEERAAVQYLADLPRQRSAEQDRQQPASARDEGAIKRWLVLAPILLAAGQRGADGLDTEQIDSEGGRQPKAGETRSIGYGDLKWQEVVQEDYVIDFNEILGRETPRSVAYAVCYIRSEAEQHGLQMLVGSDDEAKVYLNGKQVLKSSIVRVFVADQDTVPDLTLNAGLNVLVFKVVNETGAWLGSIRLTDAQGNPVNGIKVTLDPNAKDAP